MKNKETLEAATERLQKYKYGVFISKDADVKGQLVIDTAKAAFLSGMKEGAKWQTERHYSEEEIIDLLQEINDLEIRLEGRIAIRKWFTQFKKK